MNRQTLFRLLAGLSLWWTSTFVHADDPIRVLVWDEQQPVKKVIYPEFPGNWIADALKNNTDLAVISRKLDDPDQGLATEDLKNTDVLIMWGHVRQDAVPVEKSREIVELVKQGKLALVSLHSAHWSVPFMIAMEERVAEDALAALPEETRENATVKFKGKRERKLPNPGKRIEFATSYTLDDSESVIVELERPNCVFPRCCTPAQPSQMRVILKDHPITKELPETFTIPETEMYDEPFHIPAPDRLILDETWAGGEYFRSGALWQLGKGKVFYFRPGDQQYAVYKETPVLKVIENACLWLGKEKGSDDLGSK
jgi:trehalose utilization protein